MQLKHEDIEIKRFERKDLDDLFRLSNQLSDAVNVNRTTLEENIDLIGSDSDHSVLVVKRNNILIGYLSAYFHLAIYANGKVAYIDEIVIANENRGKGIGTKLLKELERIAKSQKCVLISLASAGAKEFYEKSGYVSKASYFKKYL